MARAGQRFRAWRNVRVSVGATMLMAFALFSLAPLVFVAMYGYSRNGDAAVQSLRQQLDHTMSESVRATGAMIDVVGNNLALVAEAVRANPARFRDAAGNDTLWQVLQHVPHIDAIYVSFEDGYHRVVSRIDDDRRRSDPLIPDEARWHASFIDDFSAGPARARHRRFFSDWGVPAGAGYSAETDTDVRSLPHYRLARASGGLAVGRPSINPDTGSPVISLGFPVMVDGGFIGFVGANMTLRDVAAYLQRTRLSPNSVSVIFDGERRLIAASADSLLPAAGGGAGLSAVDDVRDRRIAQALTSRAQGSDMAFLFRDDAGDRLVAAQRPVPGQATGWTMLAVSPVDDFVGPLRRTNREVTAIIAVIALLEVLVIIVIFRNISRKVLEISGQFSEIGRFNLDLPISTTSVVREVEQIGRSIDQMKSSLQSFGKYVPRDLVRELVQSGRTAQIGGVRRRLTIHFSDIAGFTSIAEDLGPERMVDELGDYFATMCDVLVRHRGTLDKFMGDGILAFFNAPLEVPDHEIAACQAALEAQERLARYRAERAADDRPAFSARIGLAVGEVVVGNIGTADRFAYTVIGDTVNLASRLESLNKFYGTAIIGSGELRAATGDRFEWRHLDRVAVVGRSAGTDVYELLGARGAVADAARAARDAYEAALADYLASRFAEAARGFRDLSARQPDDAASLVMARRARKLSRKPPDPDWGGIYVHAHK